MNTRSVSRSVVGTKRIATNLGQLLSGKAVAGLMSLGYLLIMTRTLGAADFGQLVLVNAYALICGSVIAFSGFHGVVRYGALALQAGDPGRLARIVRLMTLIEVGCGAAAVLIAMAAAPLVGPRLGWSPAVVQLAMVYSLAVLATVRATPQGLLQIAGRFDMIGLHQMISPTIRLVGAVVVWRADGGLAGFLGVWLLSALGDCLGMWGMGLYAWRQLRTGQRLLGDWRGVPAENRGFVRFILATNVDITLRELAPNLSPLTVGWLLGPAAAGLLALAQRATAVFQQPAVLLAQASFSVFASHVARDDLSGLQSSVWRSVALAVLAAAPLLVILALFGDAILTFLGGSTFAGAASLSLLVAAGRVIGLAATPVNAGMSALGGAGRTAMVALVAQIGLYPLLPWLLLRFGVNGAGWHLVIQGLLSATLLVVLFERARRAAASATA